MTTTDTLIAGMNRLGAWEAGRYLYYYDDSVEEVYRVTRAEVRALGKMLADRVPMAYSAWCACYGVLAPRITAKFLADRECQGGRHEYTPRGVCRHCGYVWPGPPA